MSESQKKKIKHPGQTAAMKRIYSDPEKKRMYIKALQEGQKKRREMLHQMKKKMLTIAFPENKISPWGASAKVSRDRKWKAFSLPQGIPVLLYFGSKKKEHSVSSEEGMKLPPEKKEEKISVGVGVAGEIFLFSGDLTGDVVKDWLKLMKKLGFREEIIEE